MRTASTLVAIALLGSGLASPSMAAGPHGIPARQPVTAGTTAVVPLSAEEAATLLWMREEEKLARDVYLTLYGRWPDQIFNNIAKSEQRHFDAVGAKIVLFGLADPALPGVGQFANGDLQSLYASLIAAGSQSFIQALTAGATIEDMDIRDLMTSIEATTNPALRTTYGNLLEGSKNHLRAFVGRLRTLGADYEPQYMDPVLFDSIVGP